MAKGPIITDGVKWLIAKTYLEHRDWRAKEIRMEVSTRLRKENPNLNPDWPGLSAVQKKLTKIRRDANERSPESKEIDSPWSTTSLAKYPIPPEALPSVLQAWVCSREERNHPFTIRQALWAARLYAVIKDISTLTILSAGHAFSEKITEVSGITLDFSESDLNIFSTMTGQEITTERRKKILKDVFLTREGATREIIDIALGKDKEAQNERSHTSKK